MRGLYSCYRYGWVFQNLDYTDDTIYSSTLFYVYTLIVGTCGENRKSEKKRVGLNRKHNKYMGLIILAIVLYVIGFFIGFGPFWPVQMILGAAGWFGVIIAGAWWLLLISGIA